MIKMEMANVIIQGVGIQVILNQTNVSRFKMEMANIVFKIKMVTANVIIQGV